MEPEVRVTMPLPPGRLSEEQKRALAREVVRLRNDGVPWSDVETITGKATPFIIRTVREFIPTFAERPPTDAGKPKPKARPRTVRCLGPLHAHSAHYFRSPDPRTQRLCNDCRRALREGAILGGDGFSLAGVKVRGA